MPADKTTKILYVANTYAAEVLRPLVADNVMVATIWQEVGSRAFDEIVIVGGVEMRAHWPDRANGISFSERMDHLRTRLTREGRFRMI